MFLDLILSAREHLYFTWSGTSMPAQAVNELLDYLKKGFDTPSLLFLHPEKSHDPIYFNPDSPLKSFSTQFFAASKLKPEEVTPFYPEFIPSLNEIKGALGIKELAQLIKEPLKYFLKAQGIQLKHNFKEEEEETHLLNGLDTWKARKAFLDNKPPVFKNDSLLEHLKLREELKIREKLQNFLVENGVHHLQTLTLKPSQDLPVHGLIPYVCNDGILSLGSDKPEEILKAIPFLLGAAVMDARITKIYCLKTCKVVETTLEAASILKELLLYASKAKSAPYPFFPDCVQGLANWHGTKNKSKKAVVTAKFKKLDPGVDVELMANRYQIEASRFFGPLLEGLK